MRGKFFLIGALIFPMLASAQVGPRAIAPAAGQDALCGPLSVAINRRNVRCNLGNYFDATQCRDTSGAFMTAAFLNVCPVCADRYLPVRHPGYTNVACENVRTIAQVAAAPALAPASPRPVPGEVPVHAQPVPGTRPSVQICADLRRVVERRTAFCTNINLYNANFCLDANGVPLLEAFLSICPACRNNVPRQAPIQNCVVTAGVPRVLAPAPAQPPPVQPPRQNVRPVEWNRALTPGAPSTIRYSPGSSTSIINALGHMIPSARLGNTAVFGPTIIADFHAVLRNPSVATRGAISATFETFGIANPVATVAHDVNNSVSFGVWQINSRGLRNDSMRLFMRRLYGGEFVGGGVSRERQRQIYNELVRGFPTLDAALQNSIVRHTTSLAAKRNCDFGPGEGFARNWCRVARDANMVEDFKSVQRYFIKTTHFNVCHGALLRNYSNLAHVLNHPLVKEIIWEVAVQHGPGSPGRTGGCYAIISRAIDFHLDIPASRRASNRTYDCRWIQNNAGTRRRRRTAQELRTLTAIDLLRRIPEERCVNWNTEAARYNGGLAVSLWLMNNMNR